MSHKIKLTQNLDLEDDKITYNLYITHCTVYLHIYSQGSYKGERTTQYLHTDIYIDISQRTQGIGSLILEKAEEESKSRWPGYSFVAKIKHNNIASLRFFQKQGYKFDSETADYMVLAKRL